MLYRLAIYVLCIAQVLYVCSACNRKKGQGHERTKISPVTEWFQHAEGPHWDERTQTLYFVDTFKATAYRKKDDGTLDSYKLENRNSIAVIIPIEGTLNEFIVGADRYLYKFTWDEDNQTEPQLQELSMVEKGKSNNQFNDGKVDSSGRLWIGTLARNEDLSVQPFGGSLYEIHGENLQNFNEKIQFTSISNGLAWSNDDKYFYFIDSSTRKVVEYEYDKEEGILGTSRVVFDLQNHSHLKGIPDGMTIDADGNLWIALFGGGMVVNVNPTTGDILRMIRMPATYVTSACFGGPLLETLYVTTSRLHLKESDVTCKEPLAGSVFAVEKLGVRGQPNRNVLLA